ncbi:mitochondrial carrier [Cystobasidium minutum MCA 4210]|uniref:mitochondrial carrier n=1 Tax=Cystobasidium minutum MCA 4210 TaxID=1397322 RepID=UPI0034CF2D2D|eukprot:jgi/Rhomi1/11738/CE11737_1036
MVIQVLALMPLRTVMNYQYRYGGTTKHATKKLWHDGGFKRYYNGLLPALIQGPIARFGDTAANVGILALLSSNPFLNKLPSPIKTVFASVAGALFRMILVPIDTFKTTMQTQGKHGVGILMDRVKAYGPGSLWWGAWATALSNFVGSFPWFATYNWLQELLPPKNALFPRLARQAFIGFVASVVSDTVSNSLRVLKTYRQVNQSRIGYVEAAKRIIREEGILSLLGRGLVTRILANGLQGILFSVLWKLFQDLWSKWTS